MIYPVFGIKLIFFTLLFSLPWNSLVALEFQYNNTEACFICDEFAERESTETSVASVKAQLRGDMENVEQTLKDIEKDLKDIGGRIWWLPKSDVIQVMDDSQIICDGIKKKTLSLSEIEEQTALVRKNIEVYENEKNINKAKAVQQWGFLLTLRQRLYNIEGEYLTLIGLAENLKTVTSIDNLRIYANGVGERLKEVVRYYAENDLTANVVYSNLHKIAVDKVQLQTKIVERKKKCAFLIFFCD